MISRDFFFGFVTGAVLIWLLGTISLIVINRLLNPSKDT